MHILIVDDDPLAAELAVALLEDLGHRCSIAGNGLDALALLDGEGAVGMVISDLNMPLMSGLELLEVYQEQGRQAPFVLLTGDDPAPLLAAHPTLTAALCKDGTLFDTLPGLVQRLTPSS